MNLSPLLPLLLSVFLSLMAQLAEARATKAYQERLIIIDTISKKIGKTLGINRGGKGRGRGKNPKK